MDSLRNLHDEERIRKVLQRRMDDSFVIAYELLRDEQESGRLAELAKEDNRFTIFEPILNRLAKNKF
jgi:hypothetical protein